MALPSNPQTLANYDITKSDQAKIFVKKVSDLFQALSTATGLSGILNGAGFLQTSSLQTKSVSMVSVTSNQTVECAGATSVAVLLQINSTVNVTLTLAHLGLAVPTTIWLSWAAGVGAASTIKVAATQPGGTAYTDVLWVNNTTAVDMTATGISLAANNNVIASGAAIPLTNWWLAMTY
jgi:hypothetical protein